MTKVSIPNVLGGLLELPSGDVVEIESASWFSWLANPSFRSFRFEDGISPYTCRKEKVKGTDGYWYGYQRVDGKVTKRYIGKSDDLSHQKLKEISHRFQMLPKSALTLPKELGNNKPVGKLSGDSPTELLNQLKAEIAQLKTEKEQLKQELADCRQDSAEKFEMMTFLSAKSVEVEPAQVLNQLRKQSKQTKATLKDVENILSLISAD